MLPTDYTSQQIDDLRYTANFLHMASPNLSARVVLSSDGGIGQLIRFKKHDT